MSDSDDTKRAGLSRRGFLKGIGVTSVATGFLSPSQLQQTVAQESKIVGPGEVPLTLNINGQMRQ